jgi:hypothetical protein
MTPGGVELFFDAPKAKAHVVDVRGKKIISNLCEYVDK